MNILYYGFSGSGPDIPFGIILLILAAISFIIGAIILITDGKILAFFTGLFLAAIFVLLGVAECSDTRIPIIKATINDKVSWQEIYNKYEFESQEDEIYTFKVKNITNEEWDAFLMEYYHG